MEKSRFSHTGTEGGLSLSLLIAFPFSASHSSRSQLCAGRLKGDYLLWFTYTRSHYCTVVLGKLQDRWMCISLLCKVVSATDFQNSCPSIRVRKSMFTKLTQMFLKENLNHQNVRVIPLLSDGRWTKLRDLPVSTPEAPERLTVCWVMTSPSHVLTELLKYFHFYTQLQLCPALTCHVR